VNLSTLPVRSRFDALIRPLEVLDSNGESFARATLRAGSVPSARMIVVLGAELEILWWHGPTSFRLRAIRASLRQQSQFLSDTLTKQLPADLESQKLSNS
jgi:hypothetical protein